MIRPTTSLSASTPKSSSRHRPGGGTPDAVEDQRFGPCLIERPRLPISSHKSWRLCPNQPSPCYHSLDEGDLQTRGLPNAGEAYA
jgi:hypothetical protein